MLFITQTQNWPTNWKQPGSDFYKTKGCLCFPYTIHALLLNNVHPLHVHDDDDIMV